MEDMNNKSGHPENTEYSYDETTSQNNTSYNTEVGSTYWEMNQWQDSYETKEEEQSYESQNHYDYQNNQIMANQNEPRQKKGSSKKLIIVPFAFVFVIILAASALAYAFSGKIQNALSLLTKSPKNYYTYIENRSAEKSVDKLTALFNMSSIGKNTAVETRAKLSYDKGTVGSILEITTGMSLDDLEALIGISLDSIGLNVLAALEGNETYEKIGINLNDEDIITAEVFIDNTTNDILTRIPDLSDAYLSLSMDMSEYKGLATLGFSELEELLKSERTGKFIKHYIKLITEEIQDVKLTKAESLTVGSLTVDANLLTVTIYPEDLLKITTKILEEAKNDEYIMDILSLLNLSKVEFNDVIDEALEEAKDYFAEFEEEDALILMDVYVSNDGSILGRRLDFPDAAIGSFYVEHNNKASYEYFIKSENSNSNIRITGSHSIKDKAYTGEAALDIFSQDSIMSAISFEVLYEDVKTVVKNNRMYNYGQITLSSYLFNGMDLTLEQDVIDEQQLVTLKLNFGSSPLVTLESSSKYIDNFKIPAKDKNAEIYDAITEIDAYYSTLNLQEYLSELSGKLGINLNGLFGSFIP